MGSESQHVQTFIPGIDLTVRIKPDQPVNPCLLMGNDRVPEAPARFYDTVDDIGYPLLTKLASDQPGEIPAAGWLALREECLRETGQQQARTGHEPVRTLPCQQQEPPDPGGISYLGPQMDQDAREIKPFSVHWQHLDKP